MSSQGYVDPNFPNPHGLDDADIIIYGYRPSVVLAVIAVVLFTVSLLLHVSYGLRYRRRYWWFSVPVSFACLMEVVGYAFRLLSSKRDPYRVTYFVIQYFFIVVAPVFLSAALYAVLASLVSRAHRLRLLHFHPTSNHNSISNGNNGNGTAGDVGHPTRTSKWLLRPVATVLNRPRLLVSTFIVADLIATTLQVGGAAGIGAAESNGKDPKLANNILLAGLAFQVACFALFALLYIIAASLISATIRKLSSTTMTMGTIPDSGQMVENGSAPKDERRNSLPSVEIMQEHRPVAVPSGLRTFMPVIGLAAALIYLRTIFRLIETAQGVFGYLSTHEAFFATLEFVPICLAVLILAFWHPSRYLPSV